MFAERANRHDHSVIPTTAITQLRTLIRCCERGKAARVSGPRGDKVTNENLPLLSELFCLAGLTNLCTHMLRESCEKFVDHFDRTQTKVARGFAERLPVGFGNWIFLFLFVLPCTRWP